MNYNAIEMRWQPRLCPGSCCWSVHHSPRLRFAAGKEIGRVGEREGKGKGKVEGKEGREER